MRRISLAVVIVFSVAAARAALAGVVWLAPTQDTTLYEHAAGTLGNGAGQSLFVGRNSEGLIRRGLIAFDVAGAIPAGSTITSVSLTLHLSQGNDVLTQVSLHRVLAAWGEGASIAPGAGGGGGPAASGDATWLHTFFDDQYWANPGGDFAPVASALREVGDPGFYTWHSDGLSAGMLADVQHWLDQPKQNFGWMLLGDESDASTSKRFDSREHTDTALRPVLTIHYLAVPGPGAMSILVVAICFTGTRRRK